MNREIKFRGKMLDSDDFVYGYYIHSELPNEIFEHKIYCADVNRLIDVKEETVGQFTGLHDKNGKEIYEGDIVKIKYRDEDIGKVIYEHNGFTVDVMNMDRFYGRVHLLEKFTEVIGNVFENGDILNDSKNTEKN